MGPFKTWWPIFILTLSTLVGSFPVRLNAIEQQCTPIFTVEPGSDQSSSDVPAPSVSNGLDDVIFSSTEVEDALKNFQRVAGLDINGIADGATIGKMTSPRCGNSDVKLQKLPIVIPEEFKVRTKWNKTNLTYAINSWPDPRYLSNTDVTNIIGTAFQLWTNVTVLQVTAAQIGTPADIDIEFFAGDHGDGYPFDGPGKTLAHSFPPPYGMLHFDGDEYWSNNPNITAGYYLLVTATHEIGHILGLSHSDVTDAIMNPFYVEMLNGVELQLDDIAGIQRLYGKLPFKKLFIHPLVPPNTHQ